MDIVQLLTFDKQLLHKATICFHAPKTYPTLFFSWWFKKYKMHNAGAIEIIDVAQSTSALIKARFETSFLGKPIFYWLGNVSVLDVKRRREIVSYLQQYKGPNRIAFFSYPNDLPRIKSAWLTIQMPEEIKQQQFIQILIHLYNLDQTAASYFAGMLYKRRTYITLDNACLIAQYCAVISAKQITVLLDAWIDYIIAPKTSLFTLSKYFFAKDERAFFLLWKRMHAIYPQQFWTIFWSEQLWRASVFTKLMRKNQRADAKKVSYKLPFTFLQQGWRDYSIRELKRAHDFIYGIDHTLKHGGSDLGFDLFFSRFFEHQFTHSIPS